MKGITRWGRVLSLQVAAAALLVSVTLVLTARNGSGERVHNLGNEAGHGQSSPIVADHTVLAAPAISNTRSVQPQITPVVDVSKLDASRQYALGMIESGNDDRAVGRAGELSRYQIMPAVWNHYSDSRMHHDSRVSTEVAQRHWAWLHQYFKTRTGRQPTEFDMYVLWNTRLAYYSDRGFNPARLQAIVKDRAQRFANLAESARRKGWQGAG